MLPDLTDSHWEAKGEQAVPQGLHKDALADTFLWALEEDRGYGLIKANYTFYVSKVGCAAVQPCTVLNRHVLLPASQNRERPLRILHQQLCGSSVTSRGSAAAAEYIGHPQAASDLQKPCLALLVSIFADTTHVLQEGILPPSEHVGIYLLLGASWILTALPSHDLPHVLSPVTIDCRRACHCCSTCWEGSALGATLTSHWIANP